jgi:hypothetical protein
MFAKTEVAIGDRFTKVGSFRMPVWTVAKIYQYPSEPPHASLTREGALRDSITVSVPALIDSSLFRRVNP